MKPDTRVEGPWDDRDFEDDEVPMRPTRQLLAFMELPLREWQRALVELAKQVCDRSVDFFLDLPGGSGKTILCEYLEFIKLACECPNTADRERMAQFAAAQTRNRLRNIVIDLPRGLRAGNVHTYGARQRRNQPERTRTNRVHDDMLRAVNAEAKRPATFTRALSR